MGHNLDILPSPQVRRFGRPPWHEPDRKSFETFLHWCERRWRFVFHAGKTQPYDILKPSEGGKCSPIGPCNQFYTWVGSVQGKPRKTRKALLRAKPTVPCACILHRRKEALPRAYLALAPCTAETPQKICKRSRLGKDSDERRRPKQSFCASGRGPVCKQLGASPRRMQKREHRAHGRGARLQLRDFCRIEGCSKILSVDAFGSGFEDLYTRATLAQN